MTVGGLTEYEHVGSLGRGQSGEGMELGCSCHGHRGRMGGKRSLGKLWGGEGSVIPGGSEQGASPSCPGRGPGVIAQLVDICTCWGLRVLHPQAPQTCFCSSLWVILVGAAGLPWWLRTWALGSNAASVADQWWVLREFTEVAAHFSDVQRES